MNKILSKSFVDYPGSTGEYFLDCMIYYKRKIETRIKNSIYFVKTYPTLVGTYASVTRKKKKKNNSLIILIVIYTMLYLGEKRKYTKTKKLVLATLKDKKRKRIIELIKEVNKMKKSQTNIERVKTLPKGLINEDIRTMNDKLENLDQDIEELKKKIKNK